MKHFSVEYSLHMDWVKHWVSNVGLLLQDHLSNSEGSALALSQCIGTLTVHWDSHSANETALSQCCRPRPNRRRRRRSVPDILHPEKSWVHHVGSVDFMYAMYAWWCLWKHVRSFTLITQQGLASSAGGAGYKQALSQCKNGIEGWVCHIKSN